MYQVLFQFQSLEDLVNWNKQFGKLANKKPGPLNKTKRINLTTEEARQKKCTLKQKNTMKRIQP